MPCYFSLGMVVSCIKILKSPANFRNIVRRTYKNLRMASSILLPSLDNQCAAGDVVPSTRKIKISLSEFKFFVSTFRKLEEIIIEN